MAEQRSEKSQKMGWPTVRLGDIADFLSGGTPSMKKPEYWGGNIPWVSAKDLKGSRINDSILHLTEEGALNGTKLVPENTVLCVVRGMSLANEFRISLSNVPVTFNQDLKAICPHKGVNPIFLFYTLFARREHIKRLAGEASHGTKKLPTEVLQSVEIRLPDPSVQQKIASFASAYDDLIENNRRRIQLLEQSARLLYKEWFVRLRFPGHEHVKIKNGVPEGWERKPLSAICSEIRDAVRPDQVEPNTPYIGLEHIPRRSITLNQWGCAEDVGSTKFRFAEGDILFGKIRPYFHKVGIALTEGITSSDSIVIRAIEKRVAP
jgi:type I restriction enzyme S subunit